MSFSGKSISLEEPDAFFSLLDVLTSLDAFLAKGKLKRNNSSSC